jgi:hypothetical protein|tara:strand:+ start:417 stop:1034 length:618 start_codon:yes stop_codon:yes gene_type:complete
MTRKNILIVSVPRTASTYYQRAMAQEHNLIDAGEKLETINSIYRSDINPYIAKVMFLKLGRYIVHYQDIIKECEIHVLAPREDMVDHIMSNLLMQYKQQTDGYGEYWSVSYDRDKNKVLNNLGDIKVPYEYVTDVSAYHLMQARTLGKMTQYDKKITFEEVIGLQLHTYPNHKVFESREDKMRYFEEPEKTLEYLEALTSCHLLI